MKFREIGRRWRIGYAVCCLIYVAWVILLGVNDFQKVHRQYRQTGERLEPARVREITRRELIDECREAAVRAGNFNDEGCLAVPSAILNERQRTVDDRLIDERNRAGRKLLLFYVFFVSLFLVAPPLVFYWLLVLFIRAVSKVRIVK